MGFDRSDLTQFVIVKLLEMRSRHSIIIFEIYALETSIYLEHCVRRICMAGAYPNRSCKSNDDWWTKRDTR